MKSTDLIISQTQVGLRVRQRRKIIGTNISMRHLSELLKLPEG